MREKDADTILSNGELRKHWKKQALWRKEQCHYEKLNWSMGERTISVLKPFWHGICKNQTLNVVIYYILIY